MTEYFLFIAILILTFIFGVTNGFLDGGGLLSTVVATRVMEPWSALLLVAISEIAGLFLFGHAVAHTVGLRLFALIPASPPAQLLLAIISALIGALSWNLMMWKMALPTSSGHALIGGLAGAMFSCFGAASMDGSLFLRIVLLLAFVPVLGLMTSYGFSWVLYKSGEYATPAVGKILRYFQRAVLTGTALIHSSNDGQKCVAVVLLAFLAFKPSVIRSGLPPWWLSLMCGSALAIGVIVGSPRTLSTLGRRFYRIQNLQGFCAQSTALLMVLASSLAGYPMSMSHVMSTSVVGAGMAVRPGAVRWSLAGDIALAWLITIPASAVVAGTLSKCLGLVFHVVS